MTNHFFLAVLFYFYSTSNAQFNSPSPSATTCLRSNEILYISGTSTSVICPTLPAVTTTVLYGANFSQCIVPGYLPGQTVTVQGSNGSVPAFTGPTHTIYETVTMQQNYTVTAAQCLPANITISELENRTIFQTQYISLTSTGELQIPCARVMLGLNNNSWLIFNVAVYMTPAASTMVVTATPSTVYSTLPAYTVVVPASTYISTNGDTTTLVEYFTQTQTTATYTLPGQTLTATDTVDRTTTQMNFITETRSATTTVPPQTLTEIDFVTHTPPPQTSIQVATSTEIETPSPMTFTLPPQTSTEVVVSLEIEYFTQTPAAVTLTSVLTTILPAATGTETDTLVSTEIVTQTPDAFTVTSTPAAITTTLLAETNTETDIVVSVESVTQTPNAITQTLTNTLPTTVSVTVTSEVDM